MEELYSIYYNPKSGLLSPYKLYLKLKKKVPLRKIEAFVKKQEVWLATFMAYLYQLWVNILIGLTISTLSYFRFQGSPQMRHGTSLGSVPSKCLKFFVRSETADNANMEQYSSRKSA